MTLAAAERTSGDASRRPAAGPHAAALLYIHPQGHLNDLVVPAGAISCMNSVAAPKLGRYAFEVTAEEIAAARVIALDLHWSLAIPGLELLLRRIEEINLGAAVVVGGISAGHYPEETVHLPGVDYVICGDAEVAFARLVTALLRGETPTGIPNAVTRQALDPPRRRMTSRELDATDCLTVDWFPTYRRVTDWDAEAFGMGRTIPVARGCPFRCPACYGSYAATFGPGVLRRSPEGLTRELRRAVELGVRNLRLVVGKPTPRQLGDLTAAIAREGPFHFANTVGFYLCTPPTQDDLTRLVGAFPGHVALSVVPPAEHVPALSPRRLAAEMAAWRAAAAWVARDGGVHLDVWGTATSKVAELRRSLIATPTPRVTVSLASVWHVTRPTDATRGPTFAETREAMRPVWTIYAARLLSPALETLLQPFRYLDELPEDPGELPRPDGLQGAYFDVIMTSWRAHHLPTLPDLAFSLVPLSAGPGSRLGRRWGGVRYRGQLGVARPEAYTPLTAAPPIKVITTVDHTGVRLRAATPLPDLGEAVGLVPHPVGGHRRRVSPRHVAELATHGLVALALPPRPRKGLMLHATLRVQEADVAVVAPDGEVIARGKADLGYFHPPGEAAARGPGRRRPPPQER